MNIKLSAQDYDVVKDGVIIAQEGDNISLSFEDLKFSFKILGIKNPSEPIEQPVVSDDRKSIVFPIYIQWNNLVTTFTKRLDIATYVDNSVNKQLSISYAVTGLQGEGFRSFIFRYTLFSKSL